MTAQDCPKTPAETLQIVTRSLRETVVRSKVARGSPQRPPKGAQEASRGPQGAPKKVSWGPQEALQGGASAKKLRRAGKGSQGGATPRKRERNDERRNGKTFSDLR